MSGAAEAIRKLVLDRLQLINAEQLEEICVRKEITVATNKKGEKTSLLNLVLQYLSSDAVESSDEGLEELSSLNGELMVMLGIEGVKMEGEAIEIGDSKKKTEENKTKIELTKFREFKITGGTVGGVGENALDYYSLRYQMHEGSSAKYSSKEIRSGVIKAMKAGSSLRRYLESCGELTEDSFLQILRSHYGVKDSATLLEEMVNTSQETSESEMNFVLRVMDLRNKILVLAMDEDTQIGEAFVRQRFLHTLSVGFKKDTVRLEMKDILKMRALKDEDLLKEVSLVVARDTEHKKKTKCGKGAGVNALGAGEQVVSRRVDEKKEDTVLAEISKLAAQVKELSTMHTEIQDLKKQIGGMKKREENANQDGATSTRVEGRRRFIKCKSCEEKNAFCTHCSICGSSEHKRNKCSKNE